MTTLGFVGLGHMGGNMAARFLAAASLELSDEDVAAIGGAA